MLMDEKTKAILDFEKVLAELHPMTPFGQKLKSGLKAYEVREKEQLMEELDRVTEIMKLINTQRSVFVEIRTNMRQVKDIRKSVERCCAGGVLSVVELFELKNFVHIVKAIAESQKAIQWNMPAKYKVKELQWVETVLDPERTGIKTFYIYDSYSEALSVIRKEKASCEHRLDILKKAAVKKAEEELGLPVRSNGEITVSKSQGNLLDRLKNNAALQAAGETYINVTYRVRPNKDMLELMKAIEAMKAEEAVEEALILERLSSEISLRGSEILEAMDIISEFDMLVAKAYMANGYNGVKPHICGDMRLHIVKGRHPLVEAGLRKKAGTFTPISVKLDRGVSLITGANMGGKTVSLKMMGLLAAMAQYGFLVPAEHMELGMNAYIYISAGDEQSIDMGLSTFGAEIRSVNEALARSEEKGLILIDELARGTNPHEGYAISKAIIGYLQDKPSITIITTHFDGLVKEGVRHLQVKGLRDIDFTGIEASEEISKYMDYTLIEVEGEARVPRDAIKISRLMGVPEAILRQAEEIIENK
ncbi:MAG TPA: DNA mismatch repair protein MutS [Clostridia bacterium]|nr:DNA mismatch repair protein MutS [Clostridia bacterium]